MFSSGREIIGMAAVHAIDGKQCFQAVRNS